MKKITGIAALAFMFFAGMSNLNAQELRNSSGNSTGKIESNGTIRNGSGNSVGKIDSDGTIRNSSGNSIGSASGIPKTWAAVVTFFFPF